jgi:hypothetical protein
VAASPPPAAIPVDPYRKNGTDSGTDWELYVEYNDTLMRRVAWAVNAPREDIEDACTFAWVQ